MPHNCNHQPIAPGDSVIFKGVVRSVTPNETDCNVTVELVDQVSGIDTPYKPTITCNSKLTSKAASGSQFRPIGDKVIVKRQVAETSTPSGIVLPDSAKEKPKQCTVIAVGAGRVDKANGQVVPPSVSVGDQVLITTYAGTEVKIENEDYLILAESEILAVVG